MMQHQLSDLRAARLRGERIEDIARLESADLLALGALADEARAKDVGDDVRIHLKSAPSDVLLLKGKGLELLRKVAIARIVRAGRIAVDFETCGFEMAQVALGFGASELVGKLPLENREKRREEMMGLVTRCKRKPVLE